MQQKLTFMSDDINSQCTSELHNMFHLYCITCFDTVSIRPTINKPLIDNRLNLLFIEQLRRHNVHSVQW